MVQKQLHYLNVAFSCRPEKCCQKSTNSLWMPLRCRNPQRSHAPDIFAINGNALIGKTNNYLGVTITSSSAEACNKYLMWRYNLSTSPFVEKTKK
ncbi:unnamed protein product [Periconia digitata]|uniref:Uncharacterized protein n=1 Tax=Periconia digitata TaxID=1303443 RepID=A0A9W4U3X0_9PLEO|nr:unnamed protein product [Periconia digitata]